jgi:hypothetical protein
MKITPDIGELLGIYVGDGTMSKNSGNGAIVSVSASAEEKEWLEHVVELFGRIFHCHPTVRWHTNMYRIQIGVDKICKFFQEMGFPIGKKTLTVRCPEYVLNIDNVEVFKVFLKGNFDSDGSLCFERNKRYGEFKRTHHYCPRIFLASISRDFILTDLATMLDALGFRYSVYKKPPGKKGKHPIYVITIKGAEQLDRWMKEIGSSNPVHLTKYQVWKRFGFCPSRTTLNQRLAILSGELDPESFYQH